MGSPAALGPGALGGWQQRPRKGQQLSTTWRGQPQWDRVRNRVPGCYTVTAPSVKSPCSSARPGLGLRPITTQPAQAQDWSSATSAKGNGDRPGDAPSQEHVMLMLPQPLLVPALCAEGRAPTAGPQGHLQGHTVAGAASSGLGPARTCSCDS